MTNLVQMKLQKERSDGSFRKNVLSVFFIYLKFFLRLLPSIKSDLTCIARFSLPNMK